jgi:hypothetical protein
MNRYVNRGLFPLLISLLFLLACSPGKVSRQKLISLIEKNPQLNQVQEINGIKIRLEYCPYELMALQELAGGKNADSATLNGLEKKYSGQYYFRLFFSKNNQEVIRQLGSYQQYSGMLQVFAFGLGGDINATTEKNDTVALRDYSFQQDFGMSTANTSLLVFNKADFKNTAVINVNIGEFGLGVGNVLFTFRQDDLNRVPLLDYARVD